MLVAEKPSGWSHAAGRRHAVPGVRHGPGGRPGYRAAPSLGPRYPAGAAAGGHRARGAGEAVPLVRCGQRGRAARVRPGTGELRAGGISVAANLACGHHVPVQRAAELMSQMAGVKVSAGTVRRRCRSMPTTCRPAYAVSHWGLWGLPCQVEDGCVATSGIRQGAGGPAPSSHQDRCEPSRAGGVDTR